MCLKGRQLVNECLRETSFLLSTESFVNDLQNILHTVQECAGVWSCEWFLKLQEFGIIFEALPFEIYLSIHHSCSLSNKAPKAHFVSHIDSVSFVIVFEDVTVKCIIDPSWGHSELSAINIHCNPWWVSLELVFRHARISKKAWNLEEKTDWGNPLPWGMKLTTSLK